MISGKSPCVLPQNIVCTELEHGLWATLLQDVMHLTNKFDQSDR